MRFIRLMLGIIIAVQGFMAKDVLFSITGILFTVMALLNAGCCAGGSCYTNANPVSKNSTSKEIKYEEVV